jgi:hypothetical protein
VVVGFRRKFYIMYVYILGNVTIIIYGCLLIRNSLFQDVLKRSGTFEKSEKLSQKKNRANFESPLLEVELRMSDVAMHRALMRYCSTVTAVPAPKL